MISHKKTYFKGLNALRFFAALLVILRHIPFNQAIFDLAHFSDFPLFTKGADAVHFFFVLSGFLITYLLIEEKEETGNIALNKFYWRRLLRIWPLYFLIIIFGMAFYWFFLPAINIYHPNTEYEWYYIAPLYALFLPHLVNGIMHVGGILHVSWSIGVEEQFYLFWAPLVSYFYNKLLWLAIGLFIISLVFNWSNLSNPWQLPNAIWIFFSYLKFHFMAMGAIGAYLIYFYKDRLLSTSLFSRLGQVIMYLLLLIFLLLYSADQYNYLISPLSSILFIWLIINTACNPKRLLSFAADSLNWLGKISYGLYMYHMIVVYIVTQFFKKTAFLVDQFWLYSLCYYTLVIGGSILIAHLSYSYFETRFLKLKKW